MANIPQRVYLRMVEKGWKPIIIKKYIRFTNHAQYRMVLSFKGHDNFQSDFLAQKARELLDI